MRMVRWLLRVLVVVGLGVDAYIHIMLAPSQPPAAPGGGLSQVTLFYAEGAAAIIAALLVLFTAWRAVYALAFLIGVTALGAVLLYRYVDVGTLGPLPNMYQPAWNLDKTITSVAEAVAIVAAAGGVLLGRRPRRTRLGRSPVA
ncbi:MAG: hypothetical protein ACRDRN_15475 [Sciscionella sp.]